VRFRPGGRRQGLRSEVRHQRRCVSDLHAAGGARSCFGCYSAPSARFANYLLRPSPQLLQ
jgi:hypothetical protein